MEQPPFAFRPSPWILLAVVAMILVLVAVAATSTRHPPPFGPLALLCGGAGVFIGLAVLVARRRI